MGQLGWVWSRQYFPLIYTLRNLVTILKRRFKIKRKAQYNRANVTIPLSEKMTEAIYDFLQFFKQQIRNLRNSENNVQTLVIYTDAGPTGGGIKLFKRIKGQETMIQQLRCTFSSCSPLISKNWYSTQMEQRVQLFALENAEKFSFQYLQIYTDSQNSATILLNPQKRFTDDRYLSPIYKILRQYISVEVHWGSRDDPNIVDCDRITRSDLVSPTKIFFEKFISITSIYPNFVQNKQNSFYREWTPKPRDLSILPIEFSLSLKRKILFKISILNFPVFVVIPKFSMFSQWFSFHTIFEVPIVPPFFTTQRESQGVVLCF